MKRMKDFLSVVKSLKEFFFLSFVSEKFEMGQLSPFAARLICLTMRRLSRGVKLCNDITEKMSARQLHFLPRFLDF